MAISPSSLPAIGPRRVQAAGPPPLCAGTSRLGQSEKGQLRALTVGRQNTPGTRKKKVGGTRKSHKNGADRRHPQRGLPG